MSSAQVPEPNQGVLVRGNQQLLRHVGDARTLARVDEVEQSLQQRALHVAQCNVRCRVQQ